MIDVTLHVNMTHLTVEDQLLIKNCKVEKAELLKQSDCWVSSRTVGLEYAVRSLTNNWDFIKRLSGSDRSRSEWTDSNIKSTNILNCSQDGQPDHSFLGWKSVNFVTFVFCKLLLCHDSLENVTLIDFFT